MNLTTLRALLSGRKTYIVGGLMVIQGLYALVMGTTPTFENTVAMTQHEAVMMILEGLGFSTVRAGIKKSGPTS